MKLRRPFCATFALIILTWAVPVRVQCETAQKAIVLAWDGAVPSFVHEMLRQGKLPNLAKLIEGGAFADEVMSVFPSLTAAGFASLWTGAPPRVSGISGNRVPRIPREQHSILESSTGFNPALLRAETLWAAAERAGRRVVVTHVPLGGEPSARGVHIQGYRAIAGRDGVVTRRASRPQRAQSWKNLPRSSAPPLEMTFAIGAATFFGLFIDDPADAQTGYDTLIVAGSRDGGDLKAKLKPAAPGLGGELLWSHPIDAKSAAGHNAAAYLRLFDLKPDGSDFFLYYTRPAGEMISHPELWNGASPRARAFIGNGASLLYSQGVFGPAIANGGDGTAETRYLETVTFAHRQLMETNRWALAHLPWDLFLAYTPFPDEAEHLWRGHLDPTLAGFRPEIAGRLRPLLERVYQTADELLGLFLSQRPENTVVALVSDHGMEAIHKLVAVNKVLQQGGLLVLDGKGRVELARTKALYPAVSNGYLLINSKERKDGIVGEAERAHLMGQIRDLLLAIRDGDRRVITAVHDPRTDGAALGIGGDAGGDLYLDPLPGYDLDAKLGATEVISKREPYGMHGFNPARPSMRTLMVLNGPGVKAGQRLGDVRVIDFAPTLTWLLDIPTPKDANGRVLFEALAEPR